MEKKIKKFVKDNLRKNVYQESKGFVHNAIGFDTLIKEIREQELKTFVEYLTEVKDIGVSHCYKEGSYKEYKQKQQQEK